MSSPFTSSPDSVGRLAALDGVDDQRPHEGLARAKSSLGACPPVRARTVVARARGAPRHQPAITRRLGWDWAHCYDHAPDEDRAIKTVLAEAHETDEREQSVPGQSRIVVTPDSVNLKKILKWIQTKLVKTVDSLRRIQQAEAKRKPPPVDRSHGGPPPVIRPTTTRGGEQRGTQGWER